MNLMVVKRFVRNSVSRVEVVVFRVRGRWENMYVVSSPKYSNTIGLQQRIPHEVPNSGESSDIILSCSIRWVGRRRGRGSASD